MKTILPVLLSVLLLFSGCATTSTSTAKVRKTDKYYNGLMTLVVNTQIDFKGLDSLTYEEHIRGKFNNLENLTYRKQLEKTLARNFDRPGAQTRLVKSSDVFDLNTDLSYSQFLEKVRRTGVDGILFVKQSNYWYTTDYTTIHQTNVSNTFADSEPNAAFHTYLVDTNTLQPVWYADSQVYGISAGYDTLNNHLARSLFSKLRKDKYIMATY
ncbi:hypothetical protein [Pontibacter arcticus]|uniref:Uncharacterized protein n=1 Tax=Pontibacter arcticus TaxID=2080288 RepID=A0A364RHY8_9BACT|nr:hypothetical protein [Pontibacter arcticus]RAU83911.1 hypothetical protein DP923_02265 [Pontibacter arcticus]